MAGLAGGLVMPQPREAQHETTTSNAARTMELEAGSQRDPGGAGDSELQAGVWAFYGVTLSAPGGRDDGDGSVAEELPAPELVDRLRRDPEVYVVPLPDAVSQRIAAYDWPYAEAYAVASCESGLDPMAESGTNIGVFQINIAAHPYTEAQMLDPVQNVAAAYAIWSDQGWSPWGCQPW